MVRRVCLIVRIWRHGAEWCRHTSSSTTYIRSSDYCYRPNSVVCRSVCHNSEPCKNGTTDRDAVWVVDSGGLRKHVVGGMHTGATPGEYHCTVDVRRRCGLFVKLLWPLVAD